MSGPAAEYRRGTGDVRAAINYLGPMDAVPVFYAEDRSRDNLALERHEVDIRDARAMPTAPSIDIHGFELVAHETAVTDFTQRDTALAVYRPEIERLLTDMTGATRVIVGNAVLRWSERAGPKAAFVNSDPARFAHVDYNRESFDAFARRHLGDAVDAGEWLARRYVAYNVWRVTTPPPQDVALAVCDARSTEPGDVTEGEAVVDTPGAPEFRFGSSLFHANPKHRWYWYPEMRPDEALVFRAFDSNRSAVPGCPHCAFDNPLCSADVTPRASVEIRAYAFF